MCFCIMTVLITEGVSANDFYVVQKGDSLSKVIKRFFPNQKIFGSNGVLKKILVLNPEIKNPNIIFLKQKIKINQNDANPISLKEEKKDQSSSLSRSISLIPRRDDFSFSILYGGKFVSHVETGTLGSSRLGVLFLDNLKLITEFQFEDYRYAFWGDSYKFKYESLNSSQSKKVYSFGLNGSYKWALVGIEVYQTPLFRNNAGTIEMSKLGHLSASFGAHAEFTLPARKPTYLRLKGELIYPINSYTDNTQIKTSSISGYGLRAQANLSRLISSKEDYAFYFRWLTTADCRKVKGNVEWDTSIGQFEITSTDLSSSVGIEFNF